MPERRWPPRKYLQMNQKRYDAKAMHRIRQELDAQRLNQAQQLLRSQQGETTPEPEEEKKSKRRITRFWPFLRRS
jgi:hypothetical protein